MNPFNLGPFGGVKRAVEVARQPPSLREGKGLLEVSPLEDLA